MKIQVFAFLMKYISIAAVGICSLLIINKFSDELFGINFILRVYKKYSVPKNIKPDQSKSNNKVICNINNLKNPYKESDYEKHSSLKPLQLLSKVFYLYLFNRAVLFIGSYFIFKAHKNSTSTFFKLFKEMWLKWDSNAYLRIAGGWYKNAVGDIKYDIAFYPFYPILTKMANFIIRDYFISGIFVSNVLLVIGLYFLYRLAELEYNETELAFDSIHYVLLFPVSFFFSIVYAESLFFTLSVLTVYFTRKNKWIAGGIFGMLAAFSRNHGVLLSIVIFLEFIKENRLIEYFKQGSLKKLTITFLQSVGVTLLVPCGTLLYLLVNKLSYGNWFQFLTFQNENWSQRFGFFADNIKNFVFEIAQRDPRLSLGVFVPNLVIFFVSIVLIALSMKKMRLSYILYSFVYLIISFSPTWLLSGARYMSGLFTIYLMLAIVIRGDVVRKYASCGLYVLLLFYSFEFLLGSVF